MNTEALCAVDVSNDEYLLCFRGKNIHSESHRFHFRIILVRFVDHLKRGIEICIKSQSVKFGYNKEDEKNGMSLVLNDIFEILNYLCSVSRKNTLYCKTGWLPKDIRISNLTRERKEEVRITINAE